MKNYYDKDEYESYYRNRDIKAERVILHSDLNNFFASVETLFEPSLKNVPLAVCGDKEARHGIVLAKNEIAKKFGVKTGDTINEAIKKCNDLVVRPTRYGEYVKYSRMAREIYLSFATRVESFGIDEAWIDITDLAHRRNKDIFIAGREIADELRIKMKKEIGVTVSVGVSFNKSFAKLASDLKKPDAVTVISPSDYKKIIWSMPIDALLFVGKNMKESLKRLKMEKIGDIAVCRRQYMKKEFGKVGENMWDRANGYDLSPVSFYHTEESTKSISNSITLPRDLTSRDELYSVLTYLSEEVCEKLRYRSLRASTVKIYIKYTDFSSISRQIKITATNSTSEIFQNAVCLCEDNVDFSYAVRAVGIGVENFSQSNIEQQDIFTLNSPFDITLDCLRKRYGESIVNRCSVVKNGELCSFDRKHVAFNSNI